MHGVREMYRSGRPSWARCWSACARERPWQHVVGKLMRDAERAMADNWAQVERAAEDAAAADHEHRGQTSQGLLVSESSQPAGSTSALMLGPDASAPALL